MSCGMDSLDRILEAAAGENRTALYEHQVYGMLAELGIKVLTTRLLPVSGAPPGMLREACGGMAGDRVVLKAVHPYLAHKSDVGGVRIAANEPDAVGAALAAMLAEMPAAYRRMLEADAPCPEAYQGVTGEALERAFRDDLRGVLMVEFAGGDQLSLGGEIFMGLRWTREFGYIITAGAGGVDTELLAGAMEKPRGVTIVSAHLTTPGQFLNLFSQTIIFQKATGRTRYQKRLVRDEQFIDLYRAFQTLARHFDQSSDNCCIKEFEVNPFIVSGGELVAVDGLCRFGDLPPVLTPRPVHKIRNLLEPESIVVYGVSGKSMNVGRIILKNILNEGFPPDRVAIIKPGGDAIDGVTCYDSIAAVPFRVDMGVLAVSAPQVPEIVEEICALKKVESLILIPGGMAEKAGGESLEERIRVAVDSVRSTEWGGPVLNGGNCLGIQSRPGRYDTLFIPKNKLPNPKVPVGKVAFLSQSGAFLITRISGLERFNPVFSISTGNQIDLTVADYLNYFVDDERIEVIAVYLEGFKPLDGLDCARLARKAVAAGKDVIFYKAGRTPEGRRATSGHTASIAGDYAVCEAVMKAAGVMVANTFTEFSSLIRVAACLRGRPINGMRVAAMSNAGFETVGIADSIKGIDYRFTFAQLANTTRTRLQEAMASSRADALIDIRNPLDVTATASDALYKEAIEALLDDPGVDHLVVGIVPLSPTIATLAANDRPNMLITSETSITAHVPRIFSSTKKSMVVVVDSGSLFNPMADAMESKGVPVFRSSDIAMRILGRYASCKLAQQKE
ncbi:acetate--CoA ligase family protein [bacterium]|nr:acetate--CoA ligase family protein [candidate division CSSED10-310 bacterium]